MSTLRIRRRPALVALLLAATPILPATTAGATLPPGAPVLHQSAELVSQRVGRYTRQGSDVALSADGSTLAVAVPETYYDPSAALVIYVQSGHRWVTQTTLTSTPTNGETEHWASNIAISADGDTLAVTDPDPVIDEENGTLALGVVHLYTRFGQTWRATGRLVAPSRSWFGLNVSLSGDGRKAVVGSYGRAFIADTRSQVVRELPAPPGAMSFGSSVAISPDGRTAVVGAANGISTPGVGGAIVLVDDPVRGWIQRWQLEEQPAHEGSHFGAAVAVTDTQTVVVGAPYQHQGVSVFDRRGTALVRTARFTARDNRARYNLGNDVAVSDDGSTVVAGAPYRSAGWDYGTGAGYRWVRRPGGWAWGGLLSVARPHMSESQGYSMAMSADGRVVVLGAPGRTSARLGQTGAAIVFSAVP